MKRAFCGVVVVLLLAVPATSAQENDDWLTEVEKKLAKRVSFRFQDETLSKALGFFRTFSDLNIILDTKARDMAEQRFTLKLKHVRVESGIAWTARLMGLDYAVRDEAIYLARREDMPVDWRGQMQERYRRMVASGQESWMADIEAGLDRTIKADFRGNHLPAVVDFLATQSGLNIVLDHKLVNKTQPVRLQAEMKARNILNWVTRLTGVKYVIRDEVIYVADKEGLEGLRLETGESPLSILFRRPVSFYFNRMPLQDALERLSTRSGVRIELRGLKENEEIRVTTTGEGVELNRAVRLVMDQTGRAYAVSYRGKTVVIILSPKPEEEKPPTKAQE